MKVAQSLERRSKRRSCEDHTEKHLCKEGRQMMCLCALVKHMSPENRREQRLTPPTFPRTQRSISESPRKVFRLCHLCGPPPPSGKLRESRGLLSSSRPSRAPSTVPPSTEQKPAEQPDESPETVLHGGELSTSREQPWRTDQPQRRSICRPPGAGNRRILQRWKEAKEQTGRRKPASEERCMLKEKRVELCSVYASIPSA